MPSLTSVFPRNARAERTRKGWLQAEFSRRIGGDWTPSRVSAMETGRTKLAVDDLAPICRALQKTLAELAQGCDQDDLDVMGL